MRFLLDENFPVSAAAFLRKRGHEVFTLADTCGRGTPDEDVFSSAQALGAILLTSDRDFYHTIPHLHPRHCGIVVVDLRQPGREAILSRLGLVPFEHPATPRQSGLHPPRPHLPLHTGRLILRNLPFSL